MFSHHTNVKHLVKFARILSNMISNDLDIDLDLATHNKSHYLISQVEFSWKSYRVYMHMIIIKLHQVLIENVLQLDIDDQLDLELQIRNQK